MLRNEVLTTAIPETGLVVLRDGDPGESDILLSPPRYIYKHRADIEVFVQNADAAQREADLDRLITQIGAALETAGTLDGVIDILNPGSPELLTEPIEGAALTLLGGLLGFLSSAFPDFLKLWRDHSDRKHELAILDRQMEAQRQGHTQRLEEIQVQADVAESKALYAHAASPAV